MVFGYLVQLLSDLTKITVENKKSNKDNSSGPVFKKPDGYKNIQSHTFKHYFKN